MVMNDGRENKVLLKVISQNIPTGSDVHTKGFTQTNRFSGQGSKLRSSYYKIRVTTTRQCNTGYKRKFGRDQFFGYSI
jgi:hypothetical protein